MLRSLLLFVIGAVIGGLVVIAVAYGMKNQFFGNKQVLPPQTPQNQTPISGSPQVSIGPTTTQELDKIRTQLYQQGINVSATIDKVYPGTGFIVRDDSGQMLFVRWTGTTPTEGQSIIIKGTVQRVTGQEDFRKDPSFSPDLDTFLKDQKIYLQASEVNLG